MPLIRSQIIVEYGPEQLGGKTYICPRRSVEISRGRSGRRLHEWGMDFSVYGYFETMINDVAFGGYHKFGSEARILPGFEETKGTDPPPPPAVLTVPASGAKPVTVEELEHTLAVAHTLPDAEAARQLADLELTERLSSPKLAALSAKVSGKKSKAALMVVADGSVFLEPPADDIPPAAVPDMAEQNRIKSLATDYLKMILPRLPNFYAKRLTTSFAEVWTPKDNNGAPTRGPLKPMGKFNATVYYLTGKEVVHVEGAEQQGLVTLGTFGPILSTVTSDAAHSATTKWSRWENGTNGPMAVFGFEVPQPESHYKISGIEGFGTLGPTAYHGEIGIDPASGTILRLVLQADPALGSPTHRADVMVEYGSVEIGGKTYTCPVRSVSYSANTMVVLPGVDIGKREAVRLNDVVFTDYHVFRAEMRIMP